MARAMVRSVTRHSCATSASFGRLGLVSSFVKVDVVPPAPVLVMGLFQAIKR